MISDVINIIIEYKEGFLKGLQVTLYLSLIIWFVGLIFGSILGIIGAKWKTYIGIPSQIISFTLSGIPIFVFLFWLHYPLQELLHLVIDPFFTTAFAISIINVFSVAEIVRNAINDLPNQYLEAAKVYGVTPFAQLNKIKIPMILRVVLPSFLISQVNMLHLTLFGSLISVNEIFRMSQRINSQIYRPVEIYTALGVFFMLICLPINGLAFWIKYKYVRNISEK